MLSIDIKSGPSQRKKTTWHIHLWFRRGLVIWYEIMLSENASLFPIHYKRSLERILVSNRQKLVGIFAHVKGRADIHFSAGFKL